MSAEEANENAISDEMAAAGADVAVDAATARLVAATRRLLAAVRLTEADPQALEDAATRLDEVSALLEKSRTTEPLCQTGRKRLDGPITDFDPLRVFPQSPALGWENPTAPIVHLDLDEAGEVVGTITFAPHHNGPPWDVAHGGVLAMVFDEVLNTAGIAAGQSGFTGRLTVSYRRPTPLTTTVDIRARVDRVEGRKMFAVAEISTEGELLAEAEGLFIRPAGGGALKD